jgi:cytochrome c biogenesis protein CcdA
MTDPASGVAIPVAFGAGLVSFLSPCVLPLVPGYISSVAGVAPDELTWRRVIGPTLGAILTAVGASASRAPRLPLLDQSTSPTRSTRGYRLMS